MKPKFKINNSYDSPENLDYDILGFHKYRPLIKGELVNVKYYRNVEGELDNRIFSDLILEEIRTYIRNEDGDLLRREMEIVFFLEDEEVGCRKNGLTKTYSHPESMIEGATRRNNIIEEAKAYVKKHLANWSDRFDLLSLFAPYIAYYREGFRSPLISGIESADKPYLTSQMKIDLIAILTF